MISEYLLKFHFEDCKRILLRKELFDSYSIKIDFLKLFEAFPDIGDKVLHSPTETLIAFKNEIVKVQCKILENPDYQCLNNGEHTVKRNVNARIFGLPVCPELHRIIFPKNIDLGCFMKVTGTVVRTTQSKMLEYHRKYICTKCKFEEVVESDFEYRYVLKPPNKCSNADQCKSSSFTHVCLVSREHCKDYQEVKIQEQVNKLSVGIIPNTMWVVLEDDLVDSCKPGDDVNICGTLRRRWRPTVLNKKCEVELVFHANYVEVCNAQKSEIIHAAPDVKDCFDDYWTKFKECPLKGRDHILASVCSQVYGLHLVKLALLLTVISGSGYNTEEDSGRSDDNSKSLLRVRGQCHLLLVGDPGTGKSQLLRAGAGLTPRSVFASGAGSTRAGLTCAAMREEGEWQLEAGALVLSDGGVCCIDEISQLRDHDRVAIHEAMEQQTISIAKAGIVCKLNTRCSVIAACNPKGHYQIDQPLSTNVSLGTPLLSRFDLIFILLDTKIKSWDKLVSSYILFGDSHDDKKQKQWDLEKLQMYIGLVASRKTEMTKPANNILQAYYMVQRKSASRDPSRTTVRMLDSLIRLSQAHCRLMYRDKILPMDAIVAITLVDLSMQDCTLNDTVDALHSTTKEYPDYEYLCTAKKLLTTLNLHDIWKDELLYYSKLLQTDHVTLETQIMEKNPVAFGKYNDVTDDNIPLSTGVIQSSYFNVCKNDDCLDRTRVNKEENTESVVLNEKKDEKINEETILEKRKNKMSKFTFKRKTDKDSKGIKRARDNVEKDTECMGKMLKNVPSVNDCLFGGLDLNFDV